MTTGAPRVFLTGASSGLGEAMALEWARRHRGVQLGLVARRADEVERVAAACEALGARVSRHAVDVMDRDALWAAADAFAAAGPVDVVVANAGISVGTLTGLREDAAAFERILRVNVAAMFDTFTPFVPAMRARRSGTLAGIASVAGLRGMPGAGGYCASKAAAIAYLESLRLELAPDGVRVVTVSPGFVRTPMTARNPFPMPFLIDAPSFARAAVPAIERGVRYATIPWPMGIVSWALRRIPRPVYDAAFARVPRKRRAGT